MIRPERGFSYVEVLVAAVVLAIALVPALEALRGALRGPDVQEATASDHLRRAALMEDLLAKPFDDLDAAAQAAGSPTVATAYSDSVGTPRRRLAYLSRYDPDDTDADGNPFTSGSPDLIWIRVEIQKVAGDLTVLVTR